MYGGSGGGGLLSDDWFQGFGRLLSLLQLGDELRIEGLMLMAKFG